MQQLLLNLLSSHAQLIYGLVAGYAIGQAPSIIGLGINWLLRIPAVKSYVAAHPAQIKAAVDAIDKEVDSAVDSTANGK